MLRELSAGEVDARSRALVEFRKREEVERKEREAMEVIRQAEENQRALEAEQRRVEEEAVAKKAAEEAEKLRAAEEVVAARSCGQTAGTRSSVSSRVRLKQLPVRRQRPSVMERGRHIVRNRARLAARRGVAKELVSAHVNAMARRLVMVSADPQGMARVTERGRLAPQEQDQEEQAHGLRLARQEGPRWGRPKNGAPAPDMVTKPGRDVADIGVRARATGGDDDDRGRVRRGIPG